METSAPAPPFYLGIDVGGTNIRAGVVDNAGRSMSIVHAPTDSPKGPEAGLDTICRLSRSAVEQAGLSIADLRAVGVATPGTMDISAGMLLEPHNLPGWNNVPIRDIIADRLQKPAILQNDANAAAYGEYWIGAGHAADSIVFWTLGTGIGCGIIIGDLILEGAHSHAAESGHIIIDMDGERTCRTGQFGTLESYASATSLVNRCNEGLDAGRDSQLRSLRENSGGITALAIAQAAEAGDAYADELVMETARYLGIGTVSLMHTIDPDMILFGGAMTFGRNESELGRRFIQRIRDEVRARAFPIPAENTLIDFATLGGDAGYIGAAGCARRAFAGEAA